MKLNNYCVKYIYDKPIHFQKLNEKKLTDNKKLFN